VHLRLGIDIACRTAHQASLADQTGRLRWRGYRFCTTTAELDRPWQCLPAGTDPAEVTVVTEPTRNAWVPLAAWFRRRGASVVLPAAGTPGRPARLSLDPPMPDFLGDWAASSVHRAGIGEVVMLRGDRGRRAGRSGAITRA
jgi:hypothetical protein